jgi:hypothetical protein
MLCFSVLVLLFRISESIATPTSVILMAINSVFGVLLHIYFFDGINAQVQAYWLASVPVVVVGAPLGAYFCSRMQYLLIIAGANKGDKKTELIIIPKHPPRLTQTITRHNTLTRIIIIAMEAATIPTLCIAREKTFAGVLNLIYVK